MQYLGDYRIDDYISFGAQLHRFSSGAVYAPTGNAAYTFYENNSTSGAPTGGNLAQLNSKTGLYTVRVQLTAAAGFESGKEYFVHIEATVDSVAAAELLMFRIVANPKVDIDTIKSQAVTCAAGVTVLASVGTASASTAQTGDAYARLGAPAGASVSADVATLITTVGVAGAGLTAVPWNAAWDAEVQSEATDALNAYDPPTKAELDSAVLNVSVDEIQASALANLFNTDSGTTYAAAVAGSVVGEIADNAGGSALTESGIADAVWNEALSGHVVVGSAGAALSAAGSAGDPWSTSIPGAYGSGTAGKIIGDNLNATVGSRATQTSVDTIDDFLDTEVAAIKAKTDNLPSDPADQSAVEAAITAATSGLATAANLAVVDTVVDAILLDTGTDGVVVASGSKTGYALTSTEHTNIADAILKRDWSSVTGEASRSLLNALRFLRNKWSISGTTLTVNKEDDATSAWTATLSTDAAADPVTGSDPT